MDRVDIIKKNRNEWFDKACKYKAENDKLKENNTHLAMLMQDIRNASDAQQQQSLINLRAENATLKEERSKAYMAANRTSTVFFESRADAEKYAGKGGATSGIEVTEITILPKGSVI